MASKFDSIETIEDVDKLLEATKHRLRYAKNPFEARECRSRIGGLERRKKELQDGKGRKSES